MSSACGEIDLPQGMILRPRVLADVRDEAREPYRKDLLMNHPRHIVRALAGMLAAGLMLTGCASPSGDETPSAGSSSGAPAAFDAEASIEIGSLYEPSNLSNVDAGGQGVTEALNGNVYESLIKLNDDGSLTNLLAEDYQVSDDGLSYTFTLREGVTFHSGKELTSADVKASFEREIGRAHV